MTESQAHSAERVAEWIGHRASASVNLTSQSKILKTSTFYYFSVFNLMSGGGAA
jgi:hypothetical protein